MPIDTSIIARLQPAQFKAVDPLESAQKSLVLQQLMGQQALQGLQVKAAHQLEADDAATRQAFAGGGERSEILKRLMGSGQYKAAQAFEKAGLETEKARVGIDKDKADILVKATAAHRDQLANVNDPQQGAQWVMAGYQDPYLKDIFARTPIEQAIAKIPQDPEGFQRWKQQNALGATEFIKQNKPHVMAQDTGGSSNIVAVPGLGGAPSVLSTTAKTNTPGELLTDERTRSEGKANRGVQMRGQDMTDARSREQNAITGGKYKQEDIDNLRKEFSALPEVKSYKEVVPILRSARAAPDTSQGDINLIYAVGKVMDPNSVVREGEMNMVVKSGSPEERLGGFVNYLKGGGRLTPQARANLVQVLDSRGAELQSSYDAARKTYTDVAGKRGYEAKDVFVDLPDRTESSPTGATPAKPGAMPAVPKAGEVRKGYRFKGGDPGQQSSWEKV